MKTTWYLHVHFVWLKLSNSSIVEGLLVCLAAHGEKFFDGHCRKRQTSTASPAKPGDLPDGLGQALLERPKFIPICWAAVPIGQAVLFKFGMMPRAAIRCGS